MTAPLDDTALKQLLQVQHVSVVSGVALEGLLPVLQQLLQQQRDSEQQLQRQQAEIDALKAAAAAAAQADQAAAQAAAAAEADTSDKPAGADVEERLQAQLSELDKRLADIEEASKLPAQQAVGSEPNQHSDTPADSTPVGRPASAHAAANRQQDDGEAAAALQALKAQQQHLAQQLADVTSAHSGLAQQVSALQDSKADRSDVRDMLADGLKSKADASTVKAQLSDKPDRSELDALLDTILSNSNSNSAGSAAADDSLDGASAGTAGKATEGSTAEQVAAAAPDSAAGSGAGGDTAGSNSVSRRGTKEQQQGGDVAQQLYKLQLQLALLQDRVGKKADSQAVADVSEALAAATTQIGDLSKALQDVQQQLGATQAGLDTLQHGYDQHAADSIMHAGSAAAAESGAGAGVGAGDRDALSTQQQQQESQIQLTVLVAKVNALELLLSGLQAAVAAQQQARRVSGEVPASSKLVQALAAQLAELAAQVARLSAQSEQPGSSGQLNADGSSTVAATDGKVGGDAAPHSAAGAGASGFAFELAADLDGRLSELEALVQEPAAVKADQADLQELKALLADTTTQSDMDQIRQRLASQQSLLDRLLQQLSNNAIASGSSVNRGSSRPQSAAGSGHNQHNLNHNQHNHNQQQSTSGAVTPEYSFLGGGGPAAGHGGAGSLSGGQQQLQGDSTGALSDAWGGVVDACGGGLSLTGDASGGLGVSAQGEVLRGMQAQLQAQHDSLEQLAEALSLLATGHGAAVTAVAAATAGGAGGSGAPQAHRGLLQVKTEGSGGLVDLSAGRGVFGSGAGDLNSVPETPNLHFQRVSPAAAAAGTGRPGTALGGPGSRAMQGGSQHAGGAGQSTAARGLPSSSAAAPGGAGGGGGWGMGGAAAAAALQVGPQVARLKRLLETGQVARKMDWFDPTLLQKMAQRLAAIDALLRNDGAAGAAGAAGAGGRGVDLEGKLRRLAADVRQLKERMAELMAAAGAPGMQGGLRALGQVSDGDHSMLSGKPLGGYRCMACDRPLSALDARPGPHLPTGQLPVSLASGAEVAAGGGVALGKLPPAGSSRRATAEQPMMSGTAADSTAAADKRIVGPQNWYQSAHGLPADQLPRADVGPHLPPGGWRGTQPLSDNGSGVLPLLPRTSTSGATPRLAATAPSAEQHNSRQSGGGAGR